MTTFSGKPLSSKTANAACGGPQGGGMDSRRNGVAEVSSKYLAEAASNAIPVGYKQTEVGLIPEDWDVLSVDECSIKVGSGKTPTGGASVYVDCGRPFIRSQNVGWGKLDLSDVAFITDEIHLTFTGSEIQEHDVLLNITGASIGRCAKADKRISGGNVNQHVCIVRTDFTKLIPKLLVELINSSIGQNQIDSYQAGGNREGLNFSQVRQLRFAISKNEKEQTAIANALSDVDALISELEKLITKKQAIKTATMQQLLTGRTRLPQFALRDDGAPKGTKPSELGEIPEDWEIYSLGQLIKGTQLGGNYKNSEQETGQPLIKMGNLGRGYIKLDKLEFVVGKAKEVDRLEFGDLLFNTRNTLDLVGKVSVWRNELSVAFFNSNLMRITFDPALIGSNFYMNAVMNSNDFVNALSDIAIGTTSVAAIYSRDLFQLKVSLPPKEEQTAIATILSDMDAEIQALEQRLSKTRQIKQGMMQELLTGKTRLIKPSKEVIHE